MSDTPFHGATRDPIALLDQLITQVSGLKRQVGDLQGEVAAVRTELKDEIAAIRAELGEVKAELRRKGSETA